MSGDAAASADRGAWFGLSSFVLGLVSLVGVLMIGQASFGWFGSFDPAGWLRVVTGWMFPVGALGAVILGVLSLRRSSGRVPGIAGVLLAVVSAGAFIAMIATHPY